MEENTFITCKEAAGNWPLKRHGTVWEGFSRRPSGPRAKVTHRHTDIRAGSARSTQKTAPGLYLRIHSLEIRDQTHSFHPPFVDDKPERQEGQGLSQVMESQLVS